MSKSQAVPKGKKQEPQPQSRATRYYSLPGTLSGRLSDIEGHFAAALTGIEEEIERTPESEKGLLKFLRKLQSKACFGEFKIDAYCCYVLGRKDGTVTEVLDGKGEAWVEQEDGTMSEFRNGAWHKSTRE